ncbi:hypothetical protein [Longitalea arenae]|uniref:hypothetical protein n=1 Tax=Longitalea arenae TaxID=2812558 RepID=UPI0019687A64|nr:hypothetical protein [Longitalea arenae]
MWKTLTSTQKVNPGDKIRFIHRHLLYSEILYKVVITHDHYFEILPIAGDAGAVTTDVRKKVVKYFDIGYNVEIEVWVEQN